MRIIKYQPADCADIRGDSSQSLIFSRKYINAIAGEMYNMEAGELAYVNGEMLECPIPNYPVYVPSAPNGGADVGPKPTASAPNPMAGRVEYIARLASGTIIVPNDTNIERLEAALMGAIQEITNAAHMNTRPQTVRISQHTNLKARSDLAITSASNTRRENVKRQFITDIYSSAAVGLVVRRCRFQWVITTQNEWLMQSYTPLSAEVMIRDIIGGIFVDVYDRLTLKNGSVIFDFGREIFRNFAYVRVGATAERKEAAKKPKHEKPLALAPFGRPLSRLTGGGNKSADTYRNLSGPVYRAEYEDLLLRKFSPRNKTGENDVADRYDRCADCRAILFEDNYVLFNKQGGDRKYDHDSLNVFDLPQSDHDGVLVGMGIPVCVYCMHVRTYVQGIEFRYKYVLRVNFPPRWSSLVSQMPNKHMRDVCAAVLQHGYKSTKSSSPKIYEIGPNWLGASRLTDFLTNLDDVGLAYGSDIKVAIIDV